MTLVRIIDYIAENRLIAGLIAGLFAAWVNQSLQNHFKKKQYRSEKLLERYADFVAVAALEISRSMRQISLTEIPISENQPNPPLMQAAQKLHEEMLSNDRELHRLVLQIRLLESNSARVEAVRLVAQARPFMQFMVPAYHGEGNYSQRLEQFTKDVQSFSQHLDTLTQLILKNHR